MTTPLVGTNSRLTNLTKWAITNPSDRTKRTAYAVARRAATFMTGRTGEALSNLFLGRAYNVGGARIAVIDSLNLADRQQVLEDMAKHDPYFLIEQILAKSPERLMELGPGIIPIIKELALKSGGYFPGSMIKVGTTKLAPGQKYGGGKLIREMHPLYTVLKNEYRGWSCMNNHELRAEEGKVEAAPGIVLSALLVNQPVESLADGTTDANWLVRRVFVRALGYKKDAAGLELLIDRLEDPKEDSIVREEAINAIRLIGAPMYESSRATGALVRILNGATNTKRLYSEDEIAAAIWTLRLIDLQDSATSFFIRNSLWPLLKEILTRPPRKCSTESGGWGLNDEQRAAAHVLAHFGGFQELLDVVWSFTLPGYKEDDRENATTWRARSYAFAALLTHPQIETVKYYLRMTAERTQFCEIRKRALENLAQLEI
ncbi:MAG: HEAT repeat domain-containing protein [Candidatus Margulisiibacteriota bacterium]